MWWRLRQWKVRIHAERNLGLYINDQAVFNRAFHNSGSFIKLQVHALPRSSCWP